MIVPYGFFRIVFFYGTPERVAWRKFSNAGMPDLAVKEERISQLVTREETMRYVCQVCGYVKDPALGDPDNGVSPGTAFKDLPLDWSAPCVALLRMSYCQSRRKFQQEPLDKPVFLPGTEISRMRRLASRCDF
jgi:rubredoxin